MVFYFRELEKIVREAESKINGIYDSFSSYFGFNSKNSSREDEGLHNKMKDRNVLSTCRDLKLQCDMYSGREIHKVSNLGAVFYCFAYDHKHFGIDSSTTYSDLRKKDPDLYKQLSSAISEGLKRKVLTF